MRREGTKERRQKRNGNYFKKNKGHAREQQAKEGREGEDRGDEDSVQVLL